MLEHGSGLLLVSLAASAIFAVVTDVEVTLEMAHHRVEKHSPEIAKAI